MKKQIIYLLLIIFGVWGCDDPLPTQIIKPDIPDDAQVDLESLSPEPDLFTYDIGYDTLGIVSAFPPNVSIITVSGIKNSYNNFTHNRTTAFALFIDTNLKVKRDDGRLIGYGSRIIGETSFNDIKSWIVPRRVKYKWRGEILDTLLGVSHLLTYNRGNNSLYPFPYDSSVKFKLAPYVGNNIEIDLPTPTEIIGKVNASGSLKDRDLNIELEWNTSDEGNIVIVVGGMNKGDITPFPLYKIRVRDGGKLKIPRTLMETFPFDRFNQILFSFARQKFVDKGSDSKNIILAQSIHNIKINVP